MPPSAVLTTLNRIWPLAESSGFPVAVAGGLALSYWGHPRSTQDVDLAIVADKIDRLTVAISAAGLRGKSPEPLELGIFRLLQYEFDPADVLVTVEVDLMVSGSEYYSAIAQRFVSGNISGVTTPVKVMSREDLILHKLYAGRMIDLADVQQLMEIHTGELDRQYLIKWATALGIDRALQEAFGRLDSA